MQERFLKKTINYLKSNKVTFLIGKLLTIFYYNYILDTSRYLRYLLVRYRLLNNSSFNYLTKFRDIHKGDRCFIVATGPSLRYEDLALIKNEFSFSVNSIVKILDKTEWKPTYYGIQDSSVFDKIEQDVLNSGLKNIFVGHRLFNRFKSTRKFMPYFHFSCFHGSHPEMVPLTTGFSDDVSKIVFDGYSVTYSMLQIAVYMGFKEIYLLGCDCTYDIKGKHHFVESGFFDKQAATVGERMIFAYKSVKDYAAKNNINIYNATRGGMLDVFERVTLSDLFE